MHIRSPASDENLKKCKLISAENLKRHKKPTERMIVEYLAALLAASLVIFAVNLLILAARNREKYKFFEKNAPGLAVVKDPSLFGGHTNTVIHSKKLWSTVDALFDKYGPTVGIFFDTRPAVFTKDLDFIKTFTIDEQDHVNRILAHLPITEVEEDCIMFAEDEQWLKLRKVIAPAFA